MTKFPDLVRHKLSLADYHAMIRYGILTETDRVELLDGEIIGISPVGPRHGGIVNRINSLFNRILEKLALVAVQNPIELPTASSQPQPDLVVAQSSDDFYATRHPASEDIFLLIEVADSTLEKDRELKSALYASAGIVHYWIVNLVDNQIEAYSQPKGEVYGLREIFLPGETITLPHFGMQVSVNDLLGPTI